MEQFCAAQKIEINLLKNREIRNALTHIDERLGDLLTEKENVGWFIDVALDPDSWKTEEGLEISYCRCYDIRNKKILHLGHELDVSALHNECLAILAAVFGFNGQSLTRG